MDLFIGICLLVMKILRCPWEVDEVCQLTCANANSQTNVSLFRRSGGHN
jgi:hypothetical protein